MLLRVLVPIIAVLMLTPGLAPAQTTPPPEDTGATAVIEAPAAPAAVPATAPTAAAPAPETADSAKAQPRTLTLAIMIQQGGWILYVIMGLGVVALALALYLLFTVTSRRETPPTLSKRARAQLREGDLRGAYQMCEGRDELLARILRAGLQMADHDRFVIQEAMESEGERGAANLWQRISYLNNIGTIAPLLGLLGTVWGMMQAFSSIAFDDSQVKSIVVAYSVSTAMITTAAGLIIAIPAMAIYYYLRGRVVKIIAEIEAEATEFVELISRSRES